MDIRIAVPDGLKGMSEARAAMFPLTTLQTCFVHLIRHRLGGASARDRKRLATARRPSYTAVNADVAPRRSRRSRAACGGPAFLPSRRPDDVRGRRSSRSLPSRPRFGA